MSSSFKQGFPEDRREVLREFVEQASDELSRGRPVLAYEEVLTRLTIQVSNSIQIVCGFHEPELVKIETDKGSNLEMRLPIHTKMQDVLLLEDAFQEWQVKSPEQYKKMSEAKMFNQTRIDRFVSYLHHRYGDDTLIVANTLTAWIDLNFLEDESGQSYLDRLHDASLDSHKVMAINTLWNHSPEDEVFNDMDIANLGLFSGFITGYRLLRKRKLKNMNKFEKSVETLERLLAKNEIVRKKAMLALQGYRHRPHNELVELIAIQGYTTFLDMEAMTEYDVWKKIEFQKMREAKLGAKKRQAMLEYVEKGESIMELVDGEATETKVAEKDWYTEKLAELKPDDPEELVFLEEDGREAWRKARTYLAEHKEEPRRRILDVLPCAEYKQELDELRRTGQWPALGAKEREITNRICSEVMRIGYSYHEFDGRSHEEMTFKAGTPVFAVKNQALTCFTGPWLIASLCLECGIPYENLYYCNVNENHNNSMAGSHGALLVRYTDGSSGFLDYAFGESNRSFSTGCIEKADECKQLGRLAEHADVWAKDGDKVPGDPVHISVQPSVCKAQKIYRDFHVLPLDEGFTATQLLHTGLSFLDEGRKEEALEAFELGLTFFPSSPDLLCQCAIIHYEAGDIQKAEWLLDLALSEYKNHILSLFYKAKVCHLLGRIDEATIIFNKVGFDCRKIWGDDSLREQANRYALQRQHETLPEFAAIIQWAKKEKEEGKSILTRCETHLL